MNNFDTFYMSDEEISSFKQRAKSGIIGIIIIDTILCNVGYALSEISKRNDLKLINSGFSDSVCHVINAYLNFLILWVMAKYIFSFAKHMKFLLYGIKSHKNITFKRSGNIIKYVMKLILTDILYPVTVIRFLKRKFFKKAIHPSEENLEKNDTESEIITDYNTESEIYEEEVEPVSELTPEEIAQLQKREKQDLKLALKYFFTSFGGGWLLAPGILMLIYSDKLCIPKTVTYVVASLIIAISIFLFIKYLIKFVKITSSYGGCMKMQWTYNSDKTEDEVI